MGPKSSSCRWIYSKKKLSNFFPIRLVLFPCTTLCTKIQEKNKFVSSIYNCIKDNDFLNLFIEFLFQPNKNILFKILLNIISYFVTVWYWSTTYYALLSAQKKGWRKSIWGSWHYDLKKPNCYMYRDCQYYIRLLWFFFHIVFWVLF